jgi:hypothetical protein
MIYEYSNYIIARFAFWVALKVYSNILLEVIRN